MTKPLVLVFYENSLLGSQLVNRLQDLGYRAQALTDGHALARQVAKDKPLLVVAELAFRNGDICQVYRDIRQNQDTNHIPILAFTNSSDEGFRQAARDAGATLVSLQDAMLSQLPHLLAQALEIE